MAPTRTRTVKNKHAANKSGISNSKSSRSSHPDGVVKPKRSRGKATATQAKLKSGLSETLKNRSKKKTYTDKELGIPNLNTVTPLGVVKPKGKKKGKVFIDDRESMNTILAMVQAEKDGQIESKMTKARQMEEIRQARQTETEKKEADRMAKLDETKESLRRKRKRIRTSDGNGDDSHIREARDSGTKATKPRKKAVSFA